MDDECKFVEIENVDEWKRTLDDLLKYVVFPENRAGKKSKDLVYNHLFASLNLKVKED